jgi:16S rRNA (uracil1498-N3)-methyltransferase
MARYRSFLFPEATRGEGFLILDPRESHHLVRVFRARVGESIEVLDGQGQRYLGRIELAHGKAVRVKIDHIEATAAVGPSVTLLQSMPKGKAMDLILRMATEIGASAVQPVITQQGEVQMDGSRLGTKLEKWRLTMVEACKQCGLSRVPQLAQPLKLQQWLNSNELPAQELRMVASLESDSCPLLEVMQRHNSLRSVVIAVGPEGDFSGEEYAALRQAGFKPVRLGQNVLRAETAAAYLLSVVDQALQVRA